MTPHPAQDAEQAVPPGMYVDAESGLTLPQGVRTRSIGRVIAAYLTAVLLFIVTLGIGYLIWSLVTWGHGQTPAQRLFGLRCWQSETGRTASRRQMALRQISGLLFNGELLAGVLILFNAVAMASVGDFLLGTVVLHDPGRCAAEAGSRHEPSLSPGAHR